MKMVSNGGKLQFGTGMQVVNQWSFKPAFQSDLDDAMYPKLSPHSSWEHAEQIMYSSASSRATLLNGR